MTSETYAVPQQIVWPVQLTNDWEESADLILFDLKDRYPNAETGHILDVLFFEAQRVMSMHNEYPSPDWSDKETLRFINYIANKLVEFDDRKTEKHVVRLTQKTVWEVEVEASDENAAIEMTRDWGREELNDDDIVSNVWETEV